MDTSLMINNFSETLFFSKKFSDIMEHICLKISCISNLHMEDIEESKISVFENFKSLHNITTDTLSEIDVDILSVSCINFWSKDDQTKLSCLKDTRDHLQCLILHLKDTTETSHLFDSMANWHDSVKIQMREIVPLAAELLQYWELIKVIHMKAHIKECLNLLQNMEDASEVSSLISIFKDIGNKVLKLIELLKEKEKDSTNNDRQILCRNYITSFLTASLILGKILKIFVHQSSDSLSKVHIRFGLKMLHAELNSLLASLISKDCNLSKNNLDDETGHFITKMDMVLDLLSPDQRYMLKDKLDIITDVTIEYCMTVSQLSEEHHREDLIKICQEIIRQKNSVLQLYKKNEFLEKASEIKYCLEFEVACESLSQEFEKLERQVSQCVLRAIVKNFSQRYRYIDNLLKTAMQLKVENNSDKSQLEVAIDTFTDHFDKIYQTSLFTLACSTDLKKAAKISSVLKIMEAIDREVIPALLSFVNCNENSTQDNIEYLRLLHHLWKDWSENLYRSVIAITDSQALINCILSIMHERVDNLLDEDSDNELQIISEIEILLRCTKQILDIISSNVVSPLQEFLKESTRNLKIAHNALEKVKKASIIDFEDSVTKKRLIKYSKILLSASDEVKERIKNYFLMANDKTESVMNTLSVVCSEIKETCSENFIENEINDNGNMPSDCECKIVPSSNAEEYSLADMMEEMTTFSAATSNLTSLRPVKLSQSSSSIESQIERKERNHCSNLSDSTLSQYQSIVNSFFANSELENTQNSDAVIWKEEDNAMVAVASEMCKLLNQLCNVMSDDLSMEDVINKCNELMTKAEELSSLASSLFTIISDEKNVEELQYRCKQVTSSCSQLKMVINMTKISSNEEDFGKDIVDIFPKFSANVKHDISCLLFEAEKTCAELSVQSASHIKIPQWHLKKESKINESNLVRSRRSIRRRVSLRRCVLNKVGITNC